MPIASSLSPVEDPRKIDSTWHIPPGWKKRELGLSQLTWVMVAVWEKMGAEIRSRTATQMARTSIPWSWWGWCPATGRVTRFTQTIFDARISRASQ